MIPNQTTRLRWLGYDYELAANALGFPGPLYPTERAPGSLRIMTIGDAFTSAEGVDTPRAWPRLLEGALARRFGGRPVEVQNFGVTGYGPNQYAAVAEVFVPTLKPDMLVMTMFVNDFDDVATSNAAFRRSIGFGKTGAESLYAVLTLGHLTTLASGGALKLAFERVLGKPDRADANFAQLNAFRNGAGPDVAANQAMLRDELERVRRIAEANGIRLLLLRVPANIQVCGPADLDVYPRNVDLGDKIDLGKIIYIDSWGWKKRRRATGCWPGFRDARRASRRRDSRAKRLGESSKPGFPGVPGILPKGTDPRHLCPRPPRRIGGDFSSCSTE